MVGNEHDPDDETMLEAAFWFARLRGGELTDPMRRQFSTWLDADPRNQDALRSLKSLWYALDQPAQMAGHDRWYRAQFGIVRRTRSIKTMALAAITSLACVFTLVLWSNGGLIERAFADHATAPGERREFLLADGSRLLLDGDSAVDIVLAQNLRRVYLIRGRVWFDVARDKKRPFIVVSGPIETKVLGTSFSVDIAPYGADVTVERGLVTVSDSRGANVELISGETVTFTNSRLGKKSTIDPDVSLAWRRGLLVFNHTPLDHVARELSRMSSGPVIVRHRDGHLDPHLSGVFRVDDPDAIMTALRAAHVKAVRIPGLATIIY